MFTSVNLLQDRSNISNYISNTLLTKIEQTLESGEKVLLYLNKRWSHGAMICEDCSYLFECPNCDVSLSVHTHPQHFMCHICTHRYNIPQNCPECSGTNLKSVGIGTQQVETVLKEYFTSAKVYRFDSDSMKNISSKKAALGNIEDADIVIGTKMLTTWFNFDNIACIGILLVESELWYPSYDAQERAYINLRQLIGRGNRNGQKTDIILQTFIPKNPTILRLTEQNYKDYFTQTLSERKDFLYPPYKEMVTLEYRHEKHEKVLEYLEKLEHTIKSQGDASTYSFLRWSNTFRKNNTYHGKLIIKWDNVRDILSWIQNTILREKRLSLIFR